MAAAGVPPEDEPGEEDHRNDEHGAGDDADPGRDRDEATMPGVGSRLGSGRTLAACYSRPNCCRFGVWFRCFSHVSIMPTPKWVLRG